MQQVREQIALFTPVGPQGIQLWANNATQELAALAQEFGFRLNRVAPLDGSENFTSQVTFEAGIKILDSTGADSAVFSHDGTDFNSAFTGTTDWNLTGLTAISAGTVDADFDAITATSYGGITEANLLDKSAAETVTGDWTFMGASPTVKFEDTTLSAYDYWIHVNSNQFFILTDRDGDGLWESPHPLQLNASDSTALLFGSTVWTSANDGTGSGLDADLLDGSDSSAFAKLADNETVSGRWVFTDPGFPISIQASNPKLHFRSTGSAIDEKVWDIVAVTAGQLRFRTISDAESGAINWLTVDRTGTAVDNARFFADQLRVDGDLASSSPGGSLYLQEKAAANADVSSWGQLWVKTATPNQLWFTDDAGNDTQIV